MVEYFVIFACMVKFHRGPHPCAKMLLKTTVIFSAFIIGQILNKESELSSEILEGVAYQFPLGCHNIPL